MGKLSTDFQEQFSVKLLFDGSILERIDPSVKLLHEWLWRELNPRMRVLQTLALIKWGRCWPGPGRWPDRLPWDAVAWAEGRVVGWQDHIDAEL